MISLWTKPYLPDLSTAWQDTYVLSRFSAYGEKASFAPLYADDKGNFLSILDGNAFLCGPAIDVDEWSIFLSMRSDVSIISAERSIADAIAERLHKQVHVKKVMTLQNTLPAPSIALTIPTPRQIYPLLTSVFGGTVPAFESWYVDVSHRIRHGLCKTIGVERDEKLVSTAMTVAESSVAMILGAVATDGEYRKQGFAGQCLRGLAQNEDRKIMISPKNEYAESLYASMGFVVSDFVGEIYIKG